jgi:hypothetical protein
MPSLRPTTQLPRHAPPSLSLGSLAVTKARFMRYTLGILGIAILLSAVLFLVPNSSHGLGTGANNWDFKSFGWPVEVWSKSVHTYRGPESKDWIQQSKRYSVEWKTVGMIFPAAVGVSALLVLCIFPPRGK